MDLNSYLSATSVTSFLGGLSLGTVGTLFGVRIVNHKRITAHGNAVDQSNASAGRDIVGRDQRGK